MQKPEQMLAYPERFDRINKLMAATLKVLAGLPGNGSRCMPRTHGPQSVGLSGQCAEAIAAGSHRFALAASSIVSTESTLSVRVAPPTVSSTPGRNANRR